MKLKMLFALLVLFAFSCSDSDDLNNDLNTNSNTNNNNNGVNLLTLTASSNIASTPFTGAREAIVFKEDLYAVDDTRTYKYNFTANSWTPLVINNEDGYQVATHPSVESNVSFIRNEKWYILSTDYLFSYDFELNAWTLEQAFTSNNKIESPMGFYENGNLYVFSFSSNKIYTYDFDEKFFNAHGDFEEQVDKGKLVKSIFKVGNDYYFTKLKNSREIAIYKFREDFSGLQLMGEFEGNNLSQGVGFVYEDKIIFGLGSDITPEVVVPSSNLNNTFYYFNTVSNEFDTIAGTFYESRYSSIPFEYNNNYYIIGGRTIIDNQNYETKSLDILEFDFVEN